MARGSTERKSRPRWAGRDPSAAGRATPPGGLRGILGRDDSGPESGGAGLLRPAEGAGEAGQDHSKPGASPGQSCGARPRSSHGGTHRQHQPVDTPRAAAQPQQQEQPRPPLRGAPAGEPLLSLAAISGANRLQVSQSPQGGDRPSGSSSPLDQSAIAPRKPALTRHQMDATGCEWEC